MTGWDNPCVLKLLRLARGDLNAPKKQTTIAPEDTLITEDGLVVDSSTGFVIRRHLVLDEGPYGYCAPLYTYDRTNRFSCLLSPCGIPLEKRSLVIRVFEQLEQQWESTKEKYTRKYFLSQKLVLREVCSRLGINCNLPISIRDRHRRKKQLRIFDDMWQILLVLKLS